MSTINWKTQKANDGRMARTSRIVLRGVGPMAGGIRTAEIRAAIAEQSPGGECKIVLQFGRAGGTRKPLVWRGEAACIDTAEFVAEERLPAFGQEIMDYLREKADDQSGLHPSKRSGFTSYAE